ncbi:TetR family transcriptional regulator [Bacillus mesophilum]|uniref:TetR/AcrR family transcriptional regulator n=1 Tax=Bacillus mesophilum TaxID=1071718 RepID=A0A7V7RPF9_9BACI|nr:TetR family transcriptional regulator [Bacillus mesophilum]KAB2335133.1 TetR/AcrR family transcriptional regulator [Bacillus mesophilum]
MFLILEKKDRIIQAAIDSFSNKGIEKTTISDIAKLAGVGQGTFYLYFSSKFSILPAISEVLVDKIHEGIEKNVKSNNFEAQLTEIIEVIFSIIEEYRELSTIIYSGLTQSEHIKSLGDIYSPIYQWLNKFLSKYKEDGVIRSTINTEYSSKIMLTLIESTAEQIFIYNELEPKKISEHKEELLTFLKHALGIY